MLMNICHGINIGVPIILILSIIFETINDKINNKPYGMKVDYVWWSVMVGFFLYLACTIYIAVSS